MMQKTKQYFLIFIPAIVLVVFVSAFSVNAQDPALPEYQIMIPESENDAPNECEQIGEWEKETKTCTLTQDVSARVSIDTPGVTLDGADFTISGDGSGAGLEAYFLDAVVKNVTVENFENGAALYGNDSIAQNITIRDIKNGLQLYGERSTARDIKITDGNDTGLSVYGDGSEVEDVSVEDFSNGFGAEVYGENTTMEGVTMKNVPTGVIAAGRNFVFRDINFQNGSGAGLRVSGGNHTLEKITVDDFDTGVFLDGEDFAFSGGTITRTNIGVSLEGAGFEISNINFLENTQDVFYLPESAVFSLAPFFQSNYWDEYDEVSEGCEDADENKICDEPYAVFPDDFFDEFSEDAEDMVPRTEPIGFQEEEEEESACTEDCFSNVAFLPGIQASRLYRESSDGEEDQLWEPQWNQDVRQLYMGASGRSLDPEIYTRDIIDESLRVINGYNVYKKFGLYMDGISGEGELINEWKPLPYDWRLSLSRILETGEKTENGISYRNTTDKPYIKEELRKLAENSRTGKVTIVAHSNGGMLAKLLLKNLEEENDPLFQKIDKLVLVAVPQLGTPKAVGSLLHGDGQSLGGGVILNRKTARAFGEDVVPGYGLLPSALYFSRVDTPVVRFSNEADKVEGFTGLSGSGIVSSAQLRDFMTGRNGAWADPAFNDTDTPNVLSTDFLDRAEALHAKLDSWQAPESIEVTQIVGWGVDTLMSITYDNCDILLCSDTLDHLDREPERDIAGDGTVIAPSARAMEGAETYYVDLKSHNEELLLDLRKNREHADILEIPELQRFIKNIFMGNNTLPENILKNRPAGGSRLRLSMYSPVSVDLYDSDGLHTGIVSSSQTDFRFVEEEISNSYYMEFGEGKYLGTGADQDITIDLNGLDYGTFTFEITEVEGNTEKDTLVFKDVPVTPQTKAKMQIQTLDDRSALEIDMDGDGENDLSLEGKIESESPEKRDSIEYMKLIWEGAETMDLNFGVEKCISIYFKRIQYEQANGVSSEVLRGYVEDLIFQLEDFEKTGYLSKKNLDVLKKQLEILKELIE